MAEYNPITDVYTEVVDAELREEFTFIKDVKLQEKTATANGIILPDTGKDGLSKVTVAVPNSYTAEDEGKVVSEGELVAQTSETITENGIYDTTTKNSVNVNVSGGGDVTGLGIFKVDFATSIQGGSDRGSFSQNESTGNYFYRNASWGFCMLFKSQIPISARKIKMEVYAEGLTSQWDETVRIGRLSSPTVPSGGTWGNAQHLAYLINKAMTKEELNSQSGVTINVQTNKYLPRQIVEIDVSEIDEAFYLLLKEDNARFNIYDITVDI